MKTQNTAQKTVASIFVACFSTAIIGGALVQIAHADDYNPPNYGGPSRTVGQGRGQIQTGASAACNCYNTGVPGHVVTEKGIQYCVTGC